MVLSRRLIGYVVCLVGVVAFSTEACAGAARAQDVSPLAGVWKGRIECIAGRVTE